jgi:hypothetical protein
MHLLLALLSTQYLDVCALPALGVTLTTHPGDGICALSVSYLAPTRHASYSAVTLPAGSYSILGETVVPAAEFLVAAQYLEDGVILSDTAQLGFELAGVGRETVTVDVITCTCSFP